MRQRRFEDVLDECISAYLEGRRSVEESLSLYPSLARRLEPLLRAAADTFDVFQGFKPTGQAEERIRQRIIRAAAERAAARALTRQVHGFGASEERRPVRSWALAGSALAGLAALAIVVGVVVPGVLSGGDSEPDQRTSVATSDTPALGTSIQNARQSLDVIQQKARAGRDIGLRDLGALSGATRTLTEAADPNTLAEGDADELEELIAETRSLLSRLESRSTPAEKEEIETTLVLTHQLAESIGIDDEASATPRATPAASDNATPTTSPTPTSAATPTATPEPQPSPTVAAP
jgi:hypothetical protein